MTLRETEADYVEREIRIAAKPEVVYEYFTDPQKMLLWKGTEASLSPQPGGMYRVNITGSEVVSGEYLELVPYSRIVFTWGWEEGPVPPGSTVVEITLIPDGPETILHLKHSGLSGEAAQSHARGWDHYLPRLVLAAAGLPVEPDPWVTTSE